MEYIRKAPVPMLPITLHSILAINPMNKAAGTKEYSYASIEN